MMIGRLGLGLIDLGLRMLGGPVCLYRGHHTPSEPDGEGLHSCVTCGRSPLVPASPFPS